MRVGNELAAQAGVSSPRKQCWGHGQGGDEDGKATPSVNGTCPQLRYMQHPREWS